MLSDTTWFEGIRLLESLGLIFVGVWAYIHVTDGLLAFPRLMRDREVRRRHAHAACIFIVGILFGIHAFVGAFTPDVATIPPIGLLGNIVIIVSLLLLGLLLWWFTQTWEESDGITAGRSPYQDEQAST